MIQLTLAELMHIAERVIPGVEYRDVGMLESAAARPTATVLGKDAYPSLAEKAAALTHSIVVNHALIDGNMRLGLAALIAFLGMNGYRLSMSNDDAYQFIMAIAAGEVSEVGELAEVINDAMRE